MISCGQFFRFRPHLPFRFVVDFFTDKYVNSHNLGYFVSSIKVNAPEVDTTTGAFYFGDGYRTIPLVDPSAKTINITFEETDDMRVTKFFDGVIAQQRFGLPYVIQIGVTEFEERMNVPVRAMLYSCVLANYEEGAFSRMGGVSIVTISATFNVMSEKPWEANTKISAGKQTQDIGIPDNVFSKLQSEASSVVSSPAIAVLDEWNAKFNEDLVEGKQREEREKAERRERRGGGGGNGSGFGGSHAPPGKQLAATGGVGEKGVTHAALMEAAKAEFTGTNGANRTEGRVDMVYFNSLDGGTQKLNFGMGNTQKYLENLGLKNSKFTIEATIDGKKVSLTGTMQELTEKVKVYGHANSSATAWKMDKATTDMVTAKSMGNIATKMEKAYNKEILAAMDKTTLGGLAHIEYGSGGASATLGRYMNNHKDEVIAELKKNNGMLSDDFVNKMMADKSVKSVMYREYTIKQGEHAGDRMAVDRRGRLTGKSGHSLRKIN